MARQTKEEKIIMLNKRIAMYEEELNRVYKRNKELVEAEEGTFIHSPTYLQLTDQLDFYKKLDTVNNLNMAALRTQIMRADATIMQIYEDNKNLTSEKADTEYFVGITENRHDAREYNDLRREIQDLLGKIEQQKQEIANRDEEICKLQLQISKKIIDSRNEQQYVSHMNKNSVQVDAAVMPNRRHGR